MTPLLTSIWRDLGADPAELERVDPVPPPAPLPGPLWALAHDTVAAAALQAGLLAGRGNRVRLDPARVLTAVTSDRHLRIDGVAPEVWSDLSGFWATADGWLRSHTNYPHHRSRLLHALDLPGEAGPAEFRARLSSLVASEVEEAAAASGAVAVRVRTADEWRRHPVGVGMAHEPLLSLARSDSSPLRPISPRLGGDPLRPLSGVRVLDLTRVIAGPVATRTLALFGAEVLRLDSPALPEPEWQHLDTGAGKRSALLPLDRDGARLHELLTAADVVVLGYRAGALSRFGLDPVALTQRRPDLVVGQVNAWGWTTPWSERRGFDSIVQAASGIALRMSGDGERPGALPWQALDHAAGYLLAAGVIRALALREGDGAGARVRVSLARVAHELLAADLTGPAAMPSFEPRVSTIETGAGSVTLALPAPALSDRWMEWPSAPSPWGSDAPSWG